MSRFFRAGPIGGCPESQQTNEELISLPENWLIAPEFNYLFNLFIDSDQKICKWMTVISPSFSFKFFNYILILASDGNLSCRRQK
ncbi:MAG: hypothetical protein EZS28_010085 [Streblomastix strix]|uniref:Uncharacterized protein n=1 Tax=Streblomastix strix TaxID=222440 RepID=A0A5J4WHT9_9EUKA|nr:MAG: hypothetical protein EZS28_010085 [Streblomastix strix]